MIGRGRIDEEVEVLARILKIRLNSRNAAVAVVVSECV